MKIQKKLAVAVLAICMCFSFLHTDVFAEEGPYTYTVTFYAGNQGSFKDASGLSVRENKGKISVKADKITVSGLSLGDIISFDVQAGAISLDSAGKYYIKGVRASGRDNNTVSASAFRVNGDADYVAAYGIKGDTVSYTVNYQDQAGNTLAPSNIYYGNVGDKPVVAYLYIAGYTPQALAVTKTLSANEAENVITFVYTPDTAPGGTTPPAGSGTQTPPAVTPPAGGEAPAPAQGGGLAPAADAAAPADAAAQADAQNPPDAEAPAEITDVPDDNVPLSDQDLLDLDDDEETPLSNIALDSDEIKKGLPLAAYIGMGAAAGAGLIVLVLGLRKRRRTANAKDGGMLAGKKDESKK